MSSLALSTYVFPSNAWEFVYQQAAKHKSIHWLSQELVLHIFGFLSPKDLGQTACVYREWEMLSSDNSLWKAFDLKELFPSLKVIDETVWETHVDLTALGLSVEDAPPVDKRTEIQILKKLFASLKIENNAGITVLTMPKGLTLNKLVTLAGSPKQGNSTSFRYILPHVLEKLGNNPVEKTYRVAITNSVLQGSRNLVSAQQELVNKLGCEMPGVLPATTLAILTYISSQAADPTRLYGDNPWTYTRCCEQVGGYNLVVGCFASAGLLVNYIGSAFVYDPSGVGSLWKF